MKIFERTYVEIDLSAIRHNYSVVRGIFGDTRIMTVLKGDAYGHGIRGVLSACEPYTDCYAVATVEEGAVIRQWGSEKPVLVFGPVPPGKMAEAASLELTFTVSSLAYAETLAAQLRPAGLTARAHIKIDTGLNRTGIRWREETAAKALDDIEKIYGIDCLKITGVYTHFACPESTLGEDVEFTERQFSRFEEACRAITDRGLPTGLRHCCATGGALAHPEYWLDMVRLGMMVYGQCDSLEHAHQYGLRQAMCWKSQIVQIEPIRAGESVSYGRTYRTSRDLLLGVISCGYADGYRRIYQKWGKVIINGKLAPILGRVCMDYLIVDLTGVDHPEVGMEVVLLGSQKGETITAIEITEACGSVCGEATTAISSRVTRYYLDNGGKKNV